MKRDRSITVLNQDMVRKDREDLINHLHSLSGKEALERVLNHEKPMELIRGLSYEDFFWLIKKVGEEDCLPLLQMAGTDQWQYLLDLEIWTKDRLDLSQVTSWLGRLKEADLRRLVRWLMHEEESLSFYYLLRNVQVIMRAEDEAFDLPPGFFSVDGVFYVRSIDPEHREATERLLRVMAEEDFTRYQALLLGLSGTILAEMEEEMYRLRNVRLAEHGFLPHDEAVSLYSPLNSEALKKGGASGRGGFVLDEEPDSPVPVAPLAFVKGGQVLKKATSGITEPEVMDRIRLEFAGLCNQLISADGLALDDFGTLIETCAKAAGYLNLALEEIGGRDISLAEKVIRENPLVHLFRFGFGLVLRVRWGAERWSKGSWFVSKGLEVPFWGEHWGGVIAGLLSEKPKFYIGPGGGEFKGFETLSELETCRRVLRYVQAFDGLLSRLETSYSIDEEVLRRDVMTFHSLLFNFWAGRLLGLGPPIAAIPLPDAKAFFARIRAGHNAPPYTMAGWEEVFIQEISSSVPDLDQGDRKALEEALPEIWSLFRAEYEWVPTTELEPKYSRLLLIRS